MNRRERRAFFRYLDANKATVAKVQAVWEVFIPNGDRPLTDKEIKEAKAEINKILNNPSR